MKTYICAKCSNRVCVSSCEAKENDRPKFCPVYGRPNMEDWELVPQGNIPAKEELGKHE